MLKKLARPLQLFGYFMVGALIPQIVTGHYKLAVISAMFAITSLVLGYSERKN